MGEAFGGSPQQGARLTPSVARKIISKLPRMLRRRSSNVYCPHNWVLCREEDLTLSAVCSTCAQAHLAQIHLAQDQLDQDLLSSTSTSTSTKDEVDSSSSTTSSSSSSLSSSITSTFSKKSKSKRTVTFMPLLPDDPQQAEVAEK